MRITFVPKIIISFVLAFSSGVAAFAYAAEEVAPVNTDFQNYIQNLKNNKPQKLSQSGQGYGLGLIPVPFDLSHMKGQRIAKQVKGVIPLGFADSYDLRTQGKLTTIKNQLTYNTCWTFATNASLESCLMPTVPAPDFSESNLANLSGFDYGHEGGGNYQMSTAYLTRWDGPVSESDDSYPNYDKDTNVGGSVAGKPVQKHVQEVLFIPARGGASYYSDNDNIKQMITTYGAVMTSMYMDETHYYNSTNHTYYYYVSTNTVVNHGVDIVGWNDNFDKNKFTTVPAGNGAFIVRNSYGSGWGESGYFYISYYDKKIGNDMAVFEGAESTGNYDKIYHYDPLGMTQSMGFIVNSTPITTGWFANIFTATANDQLKAVGFYTLGLNSSYEIDIYDSFNGTSFSGLRVSKTGTIPVSGYHTIVLDSPVSVTSGNTFCIVVKLTTQDCTHPIAVERPVTGYASPTASAGQSYVCSDGASWYDATNVANRNVCLKAYVLNNPTLTSITPSSAPNTKPVSITNLGGTEFVTGATVKLSKFGEIDVVATNVTVVSPTKITCAFDLNGKAPGFWDVSVSKGSAGSATATLTAGFLVVSSITVSCITPDRAVNLWWTPTSISGNGFRSGVSAKLVRSGQSDIVSDYITIGSSTNITCYFDLNGKAPGSWDVVVSTGGKGSISAAIPNAFIVVSSVTAYYVIPYSVPNIGQTSITSLSGVGFRTGAAVKFVKSGQSDIHATGVSVVNPSTITCTVNMDQKALGYWNVVVSTGGAGSMSSTIKDGLLVFSSVAVNSITPNSAHNTGPVSITNLTGAGFLTGSTVRLSEIWQNIYASSVTVVNFNKITCTFDVNGIDPGSWDVVVSTGWTDGVLANGFIAISSITLNSITPNNAPNIRPVSITNLAGSGFRSDTVVKLTRSGLDDIIASDVFAVSPGAINCTFDVNGKAPGSWDVVVSTGGAGSIYAAIPNSFIITSSITISSILPDSAYNSRSLSISDLAGGGFVPGSTVKIKKTGQADITASSITIVNPSKITCTFGLQNKATGYWDVVVSTGGSGTISAKLANGLLVISSVTIRSITPASAPNTRQVSVTNLAGTGFMKVMSVKLTKSGENDITASSVTIVSPTKITCVFDINGKTPGGWNVVASTGGAGSESGTLVNGFLAVSSVTITSITPNNSYNVGSVSITELAGAGFRTGASVKLVRSGQTNIEATGVTVVSPSKITCTFDLLDKATGYWDVVVSTGVSAVFRNGFLVRIPNITTAKQLNDSLNSTVILRPDFGDVRVYISAGSFGQNVTLTLSTAAVFSSIQLAFKVTDIAVQITNDKSLQPSKEIIITIVYKDADIAVYDESKLMLAYYDPAHSRWLTIPSTAYPDENKVVGVAKHLTKFAIVQLTPAAGLSEIKGYPIPYDPGKGLFTFENLPARAEIKIFTVAGQLVRKVEYTAANGRATWDGRNDGGSVVASGVYLVLVKSDSDKKMIKIAVEK